MKVQREDQRTEPALCEYCALALLVPRRDARQRGAPRPLHPHICPVPYHRIHNRYVPFSFEHLVALNVVAPRDLAEGNAAADLDVLVHFVLPHMQGE